ncbi:MAG: type II secretory pathway, component PulK [Deltaproteobacteria bacterium]|nr:MAG: type II secretory pathway, component PulK [Deltaproteobacteria bacterium]
MSGTMTTMLQRRRPRERGFALLAVFWIILLLSLLCLGYATASRFRAQAALNRKRRLVDRYLYRSAREKGFHEFLKSRANRVLLHKQEEVEAIAEEAVDLWFPRYEPYDYNLDGRQLAVRLLDENGKFSVNDIPISLWEEIFAACGVPPGAEQTGMINSIQDWIDSDDEHRLDGAENDYYQSLEHPYACKNYFIETLEELLLVKGITPELYYGTEEFPGLVSFLSVYGARRKIDVNSAAPAAFRLVAGLPDDVIEEIVKRRREAPLRRLDELSDVVSQENYSQLTRFFTVSTSPVYLSIEVSRKNADGSCGRWRRWIVNTSSR